MIKEAMIGDYDIISKIATDDDKKTLLEDDARNIKEALTDYSKVIFIDYENEIPVAFARCSLREEDVKPTGYVEQITIKRNYQNKGLAKRLLNKCEIWAKDRGCQKLTANCNIDDQHAIEMYNHSGFSETDKIAYFSKELNL